MLPKELLKKVKQIEIKTKNIVNEMFSGEYHSIFKGSGIEFAEVRSYQIGDDVRNIDWKVTARMGHPYIKKFEEERELTVLFLLDVSASNSFGSSEKSKREIASEIAAVLAFSAIKNNDKVGIIFFSDEVEKVIPPKKGKKHVLHIIREILFYKPQRKKTKISEALAYTAKMLKKKATVFLMSDFFDRNFDKELKILNRKHDVIAIHIADAWEKALEKIKSGYIHFTDTETGEDIWFNLGNRKHTEEFNRIQKEREEILERFFKINKIDRISINCEESYIDPLMKFFKKREKRLKA